MSLPYAEVIGDPIGHSKSPLIHAFWLAKMGIEAEYRACHVRPQELPDYFAQRRQDANWRGCNVTIPHKEKIAALVDDVGSGAAKIGAINTVFRHPDRGLCGINTDIDGVGEALRGIGVAGRPVVVIGAGGAARSAFAYLEGLGCSDVRVLARDPAKAAKVLRGFDLPGKPCRLEPDSGAFDQAVIVINATQLGMAGQDPMPAFVLAELALTAPDAEVFDMVYAPFETDLLRRATTLGRGTRHGLTMLVGQARTAFARFFGQVPSPAFDVELFRALTP